MAWRVRLSRSAFFDLSLSPLSRHYGMVLATPFQSYVPISLVSSFVIFMVFDDVCFSRCCRHLRIQYDCRTFINTSPTGGGAFDFTLDDMDLDDDFVCMPEIAHAQPLVSLEKSFVTGIPWNVPASPILDCSHSKSAHEMPVPESGYRLPPESLYQSENLGQSRCSPSREKHLSRPSQSPCGIPRFQRHPAPLMWAHQFENLL